MFYATWVSHAAAAAANMGWTLLQTYAVRANAGGLENRIGRARFSAVAHTDNSLLAVVKSDCAVARPVQDDGVFDRTKVQVGAEGFKANGVLDSWSGALVATDTVTYFRAIHD
jgi:hypothetical protein